VQSPIVGEILCHLLSEIILRKSDTECAFLVDSPLEKEAGLACSYEDCIGD
jgi:hypothetical protein